MRKWIIFLIFIVLGIVAYNYVYQDHRDISEEKSAFKLSSNAIVSEFSLNYNVAETKYLNKTIEIEGHISEISENSITLNDKVFCQFNTDISNTFAKNEKIKIKGRCIGYDDLLEQVKLDQCSLVKN